MGVCSVKTVTFENFDLDINDFDGISFLKEPETGNYIFGIMKIPMKNIDFVSTDLGIKFIMIMKNDDNTMDISEAILGSPITILKNHIKAGSEGIFFKKCTIADNIVKRITLKGMLNTINDLVKSKLATIV
jgi:hypothetical protein